MATLKLYPDFRDFLKCLNEKQVEYLLIGEYAVAAHGHIRATKDIDLWIRSSPENANRVVAAIKKFGFNVPNLKAELFLNPRSVVRMGAEPTCIEILTAISGVDFDECASRKNEVMIDGVLTPLISLSDLRAAKRAAGRPQDLADLHQLETITS